MKKVTLVLAVLAMLAVSLSSASAAVIPTWSYEGNVLAGSATPPWYGVDSGVPDLGSPPTLDASTTLSGGIATWDGSAWGEANRPKITASTFTVELRMLIEPGVGQWSNAADLRHQSMSGEPWWGFAFGEGDSNTPTMTDIRFNPSGDANSGTRVGSPLAYNVFHTVRIAMQWDTDVDYALWVNDSLWASGTGATKGTHWGYNRLEMGNEGTNTVQCDYVRFVEGQWVDIAEAIIPEPATLCVLMLGGVAALLKRRSH